MQTKPEIKKNFYDPGFRSFVELGYGFNVNGVAAWIKHDKGLLKDAVYVGTSVAGAFVVTYGMKYLVDRERLKAAKRLNQKVLTLFTYVRAVAFSIWNNI